MAPIDLSPVTDKLQPLVDGFNGLSKEAKIAVGVVGAGSSVLLLSTFLRKRDYKKKPGSFELSGGSIKSSEVKKEFEAYSASYGDNAGDGIIDKSKVPQLVDVFYSLVTDIYEWGWGQSFHFSPKLPAKDWRASEAAHEARIATALNLKPGMKCLDVGCGVGGPMRTIAAVSGAHVTGITINDYQVSRAKHHNEKQGLAPLTNVIRGNFLTMPFETGTFDAAYAIEATCHAPKLDEVYAEIFRVLKPGAIFVSYEWVSTPLYDANNPEHVRIMDEINYGNGLPDMRTWKQAEDAGKGVGFELIRSLDLASASIVCGPWWDRLKMHSWTHHVNHAIVSSMDFIGIAPKGLKDVHKMLVDVARSLVQGGESGTFTPMHFLVFKKPEA